MDFGLEIEKLIRARYFLTVVQSVEELRALSLICKVGLRMQKPVVSWDIADGFKSVGELKIDFKAQKGSDPMGALNAIEACKEEIIFVLKDFHEFWETPVIKRKLRNLSQFADPLGKTIIIISPGRKAPDELRDEAASLDLPMPREQELQEELSKLEAKVSNLKVNLNAVQRQRFLQAAVGLSAAQAQKVFRKAAVVGGTLDERHIKVVTDEKRQIVNQSEALEFFPVSETVSDIGGLERLKEWLQLRQGDFSENARAYKLPPPKGIGLIGIPGTGKSLTAKTIGSIWRLPLLRMDVGSLFGGLVGESEERTRRALSVVSTMSPCILWIDEIEKAFSQGGLDGGTSARVFGSILTWMEERKDPVFVVATANDITNMPPELMRKGRFDEVFFLDLPSEDERRDIFSVILTKYGRPPEKFDIDKLAKLSSRFTGSEIEQAVKDALHIGFSQNARIINTDDILSALRNLIPLADSQRQKVEELRRWLKEGRAVSASYDKDDAMEKAPPLETLDLMAEAS